MVKRLAVIEKEKCNPVGCGNYLCIRVCPINKTGEECIVKGSDNKPVINEELCSGCGICSHRCPFGAIHIINLPDELSKEPIHRYGVNQFALFSLPTPMFGKVVGILGRNGIGKSTAIKILAGALKPNLGNLDREASYDELIDYFKGTETQKFFEELKKGKIKISYKPQQVDLIPKAHKGKTVKALLEKVDEKKKLKEIVKLLDLDNFLDTKVENISGGELQRVAIAAAVLKDANLYIFDEPTSYLDIKQRIKVSKFIKSLANEKTAVLVVEHDLIILDYITDLCHIMYGKEDCYGVVSTPKATRVAINTYMEGFLKEENTRFRENRIKFDKMTKKKKVSNILLTSWENIDKKLGKFHLKATKGDIFREEVIGVLGENGIGKTSFIKILANEIKPDKGEITEKVKVSYKPQYLQSDSKEVVIDVLNEVVRKYTNQVINPLNIKPLYEKQLNHLSGGELQRVSIALCLGQDADLFLLDEPSAYLDVEQRLIVSKIIADLMFQTGKTAIVVDHDLLFIDYISNRLLVFDGKPAVSGEAKGPFEMEKGMNHFLKDLKITFRRDEESNRPRVNKEESVLDREQKSSGKYYYT